jgi:hypothetical protein
MIFLRSGRKRRDSTADVMANREASPFGSDDDPDAAGGFEEGAFQKHRKKMLAVKDICWYITYSRGDIGKALCLKLKKS